MFADEYARGHHCDSEASCKDTTSMLSTLQRSRAGYTRPVAIAQHPVRKVPRDGRRCPSRMLRYRFIPAPAKDETSVLIIALSAPFRMMFFEYQWVSVVR
jgi:hypothetical protein